MKTMKYINILIVFILGLMLSGCEEQLNLSPEDSLSPETYFRNETELQLWTNYFYTQLDDADTRAALNADDNVDSQIGDLMMGQRTSYSEDGWSWSMLRKINYYLQNSKSCPSVTARNKYDGVAYFMRAYFYFIKVERYGDVPWYNQVINSVDEELLFKPRDNRGLVMDSVMVDLDRAIALLPTAKSTTTVTKWTALALKSRVALYEGTFRKYHGMSDADKYLQQAADAGYDFIKNSGYKIYNTGTEPYRTLFNSDNAITDEVIMARIYSSSVNIMNGVQFNISNQKQGFTRRFMNHYLMADGTRFNDQTGWETMTYTEETQNRDPRMKQTVLCPGYIQTGATKVTKNKMNALTGYQPIKFVNAAAYDGALKAVNDWPLFRAAEVYLNYAEAKAEMGTLTQSDLDMSVNKIRQRVSMPDLNMANANADPDDLLLSYYPNVTVSSNTGVILEIRRERTIELALEGFRQWDLLRWKEGQQFTKKFYGCYFPGEGKYDMDLDGVADLQLYTTTAGTFSGTSLKIGSGIILSNDTYGYVVALPTLSLTWNEDRDYLWPIPASERVLTNGALTQNPGWEDGTNL